MKNQVLCERCKSEICVPRVQDFAPNSCDASMSEFTPEERLEQISLILLKAIRRALGKAAAKSALESAPRNLGVDPVEQNTTPA